ncbi:MAG TPA: CMP-binding protein [Planctomycetaceae bacterium]|nr:CMP-binding protein [Planctomycetaceae bacterium]
MNQLRDNEQLDGVYLIAEKQLRPNKNGNLYLQFALCDKSGTLGGRLWNANDPNQYDFEDGDYVKVEGVVQRFQGALQFIAKRLTRVDASGVRNKNDYIRFSAVNITKLQGRLKELLRTITNPALLNLADSFLIDESFMERFSKTPAGIKLHHAYPGGLLEHTVTMMEIADRIGPLYEKLLDRDLLLMGAFLHDVGKIEELSGGKEMLYTSQGQMLGHPFLGVEILRDRIEEAERLSGEPFDPELTMLLKHLLISHHGAYEHNAAKLPMTLEAVALHLLDTLDSKLAEFGKYMFEDPNIGSPWTNYIPGLERKLYKGIGQQAPGNG